MQTNELIAQLAREGAHKPAPPPARILVSWLGFMILYFFVLLAIHGLRSDIGQKLQQSLYLSEILLMLAIALLSALAASWLSLPDANQKAWIRFVPLLPLGAFAGMLIYGMLTTSALTLSQCLQLARYDCVIRIILYGLLPGGIMFSVTSRAAPTRCCWAGSMIGLSVASLGYILLRLVDPSDDPTQLIIWHFLPVLFMTVIGMMLGGWLLGRVWRKAG